MTVWYKKSPAEAGPFKCTMCVWLLFHKLQLFGNTIFADMHDVHT